MAELAPITVVWSRFIGKKRRKAWQVPVELELGGLVTRSAAIAGAAELASMLVVELELGARAREMPINSTKLRLVSFRYSRERGMRTVAKPRKSKETAVASGAAPSLA